MSNPSYTEQLKAEESAARQVTIREQTKAEMEKILRSVLSGNVLPVVVEQVVHAAMFPVEHLLVELEGDRCDYDCDTCRAD